MAAVSGKDDVSCIVTIKPFVFLIYRVSQNKPLPNYQIIVLNRIKACE